MIDYYYCVFFMIGYGSIVVRYLVLHSSRKCYLSSKISPDAVYESPRNIQYDITRNWFLFGETSMDRLELRASRFPF